MPDELLDPERDREQISQIVQSDSVVSSNQILEEIRDLLVEISAKIGDGGS